jgi:hypothetical protein
MNFDPVGVTKDGDYYMKFHKPYNVVEKIQLLQRWILVQSFAYYELNENIASDFKYDDNAKQLVELMKNNPDEANRSKYSEYFHDYCPTNDDAHYTSGFDLLERVRKKDEILYRYIHMDAAMALDLKQKYGTEGMSII